MKKKIFIAIFIVFLVCGCSKNSKDKDSIKKENNNKKSVVKEEVKDSYTDNNPIKLGMYMYTNSSTNRKLIHEYSADWSLNVDLCSLEVYYATDEEIPGSNQKNLWNSYYQKYQDIDNYKVGYVIEFKTGSGNVKKTILSPADTKDVYDYMQIYLYDDINTTSSWYDHVDENEYTDNTILSSIKLTGSTKTNEISSDIKLSAFTYDSDDFDKDGNYRGNSKYDLIIKRR